MLVVQRRRSFTEIRRCGAALALQIVLCTGGASAAAAPLPAAAAAASGPQPPPAQAESFYGSHFSKVPANSALSALGRELFFARALSASGRLACASCHDPRYAYGPSPASVRLTMGRTPGKAHTIRAIPSLRYLQDVPTFSEHHFDEAVDESADQGPTGGHMWDGRVDSLHEQAMLPLFAPQEMANTDPQAIVARIARGPYAERFRATFGADVFGDSRRAFNALLLALEVFQQSPPEFYPYSSKYDAWLRGQARLTSEELRGLRIFDDPLKGNCASCHPSQIRHGAFPQFTDYGYVALGVPRNPAIAANRNPAYFDLGLCGPERRDLRDRADYCGRFRVPSLRNVALRPVFFHNGVFHDLTTAVEFYARRDADPGRFYGRSTPQGDGKFDDLPRKYHRNVNMEPPFGQRAGDQPRLSEADVRDVVSFLLTLTDGYGEVGRAR